MRWLRPIAIVAMADGGRRAGRPGPRPRFTNPVINDFEIAPAGSLEWEILDRLAASHRYDPGDLFRLRGLTVLESIAMYRTCGPTSRVR